MHILRNKVPPFLPKKNGYVLRNRVSVFQQRLSGRRLGAIQYRRNSKKVDLPRLQVVERIITTATNLFEATFETLIQTWTYDTKLAIY